MMKFIEEIYHHSYIIMVFGWKACCNWINRISQNSILVLRGETNYWIDILNVSKEDFRFFSEEPRLQNGNHQFQGVLQVGAAVGGLPNKETKVN